MGKGFGHGGAAAIYHPKVGRFEMTYQPEVIVITMEQKEKGGKKLEEVLPSDACGWLPN